MNAIMIMCHKNLDQVVRLINKCLSDDTRIIVHFERKFEYDKEKIAALCERGGVYVCKKRYNGQLDDRSLVDIAMAMVKQAFQIEKNEGIKFRYYCLLSGQDYLTRPMWYINKQLEEHYPVPYIDCTPYDKKNWIYHKFKYTKCLLSYRKWIWENFNNIKVLRFGLRVTAYIWEKIVSFLHIPDYDKLSKTGVKLYGGSAWWILPDVAIEYIFQEYNAEARYTQALLSTWTPEETFFQTMTMRSDVGKLVNINSVDRVDQSCKTWAYFSDEGKPFVGHPYIFTKDEYQKLIGHDCWFARKFDATIDNSILDMLDQYTESFV